MPNGLGEVVAPMIKHDDLVDNNNYKNGHRVKSLKNTHNTPVLTTPIMKDSSIDLKYVTPMNKKRSLSTFSNNDDDDVLPVVKRIQQETVDSWKMRVCKDHKLHPQYHHLTLSQKRVVDAVLDSSRNVFFSGSAGCGKSFTLRLIIEILTLRHGREAIGITAPTGLSAVNIGGDTLHSFSGVMTDFRFKKSSSDGKRKRYKELIKRWNKTKVLIIDEISMVDAHMFSEIDHIAQKCRNNRGKPFGGVQVVVTGDFFQLPPVVPFSTNNSRYCFQCDSWCRTFQESIILQENVRQRGDVVLVAILERLRMGRLTMLDKKLLLNGGSNDDKNGILPTELFATRLGVEMANNNRLKYLPGHEWEFVAVDSGPLQYRSKLDLLIVPQHLILKVGCQVMFLKNKKLRGIVNGSVGVVKLFIQERCWRSIISCLGEELQKKEMVELVVLILPFIYDRQKMIGMQAVVAKLQKGKYVRLLQKMINCICEAVELQHNNEPRYPVVQISPIATTNIAPILELVKPELSTIDTATMTLPVYRVQLPLVLSWALSIHKSQGQTLRKVRVDGSRIFERGQLYVAMSRVSALDQLQVVNVDWENVVNSVDPLVVEFYHCLMNRK